MVRTGSSHVLAGFRLARNQTPAMGCNTKWRLEHAPDHAR